jgi:hypothetical protein
MDDVGIEYQTVLGYPPVEFVHLAADLGCHAISMKPRTGPYNAANSYGYGDFSFLDDTGARREMAAALRERAVAVSLAEGFVAVPGSDLLDDLASLDVMGELGATRANVVTMDADLGRSFDSMRALPAGLPVGVEAPMRSRAAAGIPARTCAQLAVEGARGVLARVGSGREDAAE